MIAEPTTLTGSVAPSKRQIRQSMARLHAREARMGVLWVIPTAVGIVVFTAGPIVASFALSLFQIGRASCRERV